MEHRPGGMGEARTIMMPYRIAIVVTLLIPLAAYADATTQAASQPASRPATQPVELREHPEAMLDVNRRSSDFLVNGVRLGDPVEKIAPDAASKLNDVGWYGDERADFAYRVQEGRVFQILIRNAVMVDALRLTDEPAIQARLGKADLVEAFLDDEKIYHFQKRGLIVIWDHQESRVSKVMLVN